ncbi:hypothetical protein ACFLSQ_00245 [Bacteroidota bacterium]
MSKRFTDTDKWKDEWFKKLPTAYKLLWLYILDDCNHAGIWHSEFEIAQIRIGKENIIDKESALSIFGDKVVQIDDGRKWFIPSFVTFQYGELNPENKAHNSVIKILKENDLENYINYSDKPLKSSSRGAEEKEKNKDKIIFKIKDKDKIDFN